MNGCESSTRIEVNVTITTSPVLNSETIAVCAQTTLNQISVQGYTFDQIDWYSSAISSNTIAGSTILVDGMVLFAEINSGNCSSDRVPITFQVMPTVPIPNVSNVIHICVSGTVSDLPALGIQGGAIEWFNSATGTVPLPANATLQTGTYYVSQRYGDCQSAKKIVSVVIISTAAPLYNSLQVCQGFTIEEVDWIAPTGAIYEWYTTPSSQTPLSHTTELVSGVYYVGRYQPGCRSARAMVHVTVNPKPNAPTGLGVQLIAAPATLMNIFMDQTDIIWYATEEDALNHTYPLANTTILQDGVTYYGVLMSATGCYSDPTPVTVNLFLGINDLDLTHLKVYPNPTTDIVNIEYNEVIDSIEVYSILGQRLQTWYPKNIETQINLKSLATGTYMLKIQVGSNSQMIKIMKK